MPFGGRPIKGDDYIYCPGAHGYVPNPVSHPRGSAGDIHAEFTNLNHIVGKADRALDIQTCQTGGILNDHRKRAIPDRRVDQGQHLSSIVDQIACIGKNM